MSEPNSSASPLRRAMIPLGVLALGVILAYLIFATREQKQRRPREKRAPLVEVAVVEAQSPPIVIQAMGTLQASRLVALQAQVSGEIVKMSEKFIPGGFLPKGKALVSIDPSNYELAVTQRESDYKKALSALALEEGNQEIARREYELAGEKFAEGEQDLVLRRPQLKTAQADVDAARCALEEARLSLARTIVDLPFDATVLSKEVDLGSVVSPASPLATIASTDEFWVEVFLPERQLEWIAIPSWNAKGEEGEGSVATIILDDGRRRQGRVLRLVNALEPEGRMARLLIAVKDPLNLENRPDTPRLLINSYVRVEIEGRSRKGLLAIARDWLRPGGVIWVMNAENALEIRPVDLALRNRQWAYLQGGLSPGERVVTTNLSTPVEGMQLRVATEK